MHKSIVQAARRWATAAAIAALVAGSGAANAAVFVTKWDPLLSLALNGFLDNGMNVYWKGEAFVSVDESCLTDGLHLTVTSFKCGSATLDSGVVSFFDRANDDAPILPDLSWNEGSPTVLAVNVDDVTLVGILTLGAVKFDDVTNFAPNIFDVYLSFGLFSGPSLTLVTQGCDIHSFSYSNCQVFKSGQDGPDSVPDVTWTRVPEPTSLALVGLALAALGLIRWRSKRG